jgi:hypothetical protein
MVTWNPTRAASSDAAETKVAVLQQARANPCWRRLVVPANRRGRVVVERGERRQVEQAFEEL